MFTCKICGRKFKSIKALGGHTSSAHPANPAEPTEGENGNPEPVEAETEDESVAAEIREYLSRGYSFEQLTKQLHFKERTVRQEMAKMVVPASEQDTNLPMTYKQTEVISPEAVLRRYMDGSYEDELELRGMMKLRAAMLMVMELASIQKTVAEADAKRLDPLLRVLKESREELDAAAARARGASFEMAQEAAEGAVGRVLGYIDQKIPKEPPPKDMSEMVTKRIDKMWDMMSHMMEQRMFPGYQENKPPEGWEYEKLTSSAPASAHQEPAQEAQGSPPGWATEKQENNEKEEDSDV
jgi:hypothetical protein